ncbi:hypothetical protein BTR14_17095 [Rhizobium rhizosphaerae]|uniref:DUF2177 family protein n=1 Tax=Xaviernesmea rhizosphaerae TaxID=1672749 RepID=A0ABX3PB21_9HYPH|nr:DUF2177 family protein [Xaviernesmea rhizosphaerae]OQP85077.1 hypothetical protein BTR14_17095 [Xaviernesmea rhizosphaerae]
MKAALTAYAATLVTFLAIDAVWLGLVARTFYRDQLGELMLPQPNFVAAAVFYLFFAVAVVILAVMPGLRAGSILVAMGYGAVLGLAAYGTYDMTNLSTLKGWPALMSFVDMGWGTILTAVSAGAGAYAVRLFAANG